MILDNADDLDTFFAKPTSEVADVCWIKPLSDYLPQDSQGLMLITTRDERMSKRLAGKNGYITVGRMSTPEAHELLHSHLEQSNSSNDDYLKSLIAALDYIPLAITQAAAFISHNSIGIADYLDLFSTNDSELQTLLDEDVGDPRRDSQSQNSVIRTWKLSFDLINKQKPRAAEMLSLIAVLDRQGIPKCLLRTNTDRETDVMTALGTLIAFSLISTEDNGASYEIHRLVQLATADWLEMQGTQTKWQAKALLVLADTFPTGEFETWEACESLLPHAEKVLQYQDIVENYPEQYSCLLHNMGRFDYEQGRFELACIRSSTAFEVQKKIFGLEHPDTLTSMANLASTYAKQGRWEEAEKLGVQVMETRLRVLKAEHPDTLRSMANLAFTYHSQERHSEAIELMQRVIELRTKRLGANHPDTLDSIETLKDWSDT